MMVLEKVVNYSSDLTLLYVEDDTATLARNQEVLQLFFRRVDLAVDGTEGLAKYRQMRESCGCDYDVVMTDILIPNMDGIDLCREIRLLNPEQSIIVLSAHRDTGSLFELINMGVQHYLLKPLAIEQLSDILYRVCKGIVDTQTLHAKNDEISRLNLQLEQKVRALNTAFEKLEAMTRYKELFFASVTHDLRTPMSGILGMCDLLLQTELSSHQHDWVEKLKFSGDHMMQLMNDILDFSKIEAGSMEIEQIAFELEGVLEYAADNLMIQVSKKGLELIFDIEPEVPHLLMGDPLRLSQVLLNLLSNAVKFTDQGYISLHVHCDGDQIYFEVQDTGIGMNAQQRSALFQDYHQAERSTGRRYGGTGLGLNIAKRLIILMGGGIEVQSEQGSGTVIRFMLPLLVPEESEQRLYRIPSHLAMDKKVLIVDTRTKSAHVLEKKLHYFRAETLYATTFEEALRLGGTQRYDLVFVQASQMGDVIAPRQFLLQEGKLVMIFEAADLINLPHYHFDGKIQKPVTIGTLFRLMEQLYDTEDKKALRQDERSKMRQYVGSKVLLAEDNLINQRVVSGFLKAAGIEAKVVPDGQAALEAIEREDSFDLILMDIYMPILDGFGATSRLRERGVTTPIVALSGDGTDATRKAAIQCGMQGFLPKPISVTLFYDTLEKYLRV